MAEQNRLLVRLVADARARRGELAALRLSDLTGRVLTIERNLSLEVLGSTKTGRSRRGTSRDRRAWTASPYGSRILSSLM